MISIPYSRTNGIYTFTDAIVLDDDAYAAMTAEEITVIQDARFVAWLDFITAASNAPADEVTNGN